jgi:hypothetical protein
LSDHDEAALHEAVRVLRSPATIRERCAAITATVAAGRSEHFRIDRTAMPAVAGRVARLTRQRYPDLKVPVHSRWRHFQVGGVNRVAELEGKIAGHSTTAGARAMVDLALVSVLLDAGAGPAWSYREHESGLVFQRSEGLAVATFRAFMAGRFSSDPGDPCRVDAAALLGLDEAVLADIFQADPGNPLVGLDGRAALMQRLGMALRDQPERFTSIGQPGHVLDALTYHAHAPRLRHHRPAPGSQQHHQVSAGRILRELLDAFSGIWPQGTVMGQVPMGDVWRHPAAGGQGPSAGYVPFHKLSQWLAYSLIEPFQRGGITVIGLDELTALPEYRNGGLLLDAGVIVPLDPLHARQRLLPQDPWVVEWRALTVTLIDEMAPLVREALGLDAGELPLAAVLEGGTWAAGRQIAAEQREGGAPPVQLASDGTVF